MIDENIKKNNEYVWASIFIDYINTNHDTDYILRPEWGESSPVDIHAVSASEKFPHLDLQLTYAVELPFVSMGEDTSANYSKEPTIKAIERKMEKYRSQDTDVQNIVLVVQGYMKTSVANKVFNDKDFTHFKQYPFKGIYYVSPPMLSEESGEHLQSGYVKAIKSMF